MEPDRGSVSVFLSQHPTKSGGDYHIAATTACSLESLIKKYNHFSDTKIDIVAFDVFIKKLKEAVQENKDIPIPYFIKEYLDRDVIDSEDIYIKSESVIVKSEKTMRFLTENDVIGNEISNEMLINYFNNPLI